MLSGKDSMANEMDIIVKSIPGLTYIKDFITLEEEERIVFKSKSIKITASNFFFQAQHINDSEWAIDLKRRVQQYGYTFNHESQQVKISTPTPPMPQWLEFLRYLLRDFVTSKKLLFFTSFKFTTIIIIIII